MQARQTFLALEPATRAAEAIESLRHKVQRDLRAPNIRWTRSDAWLIKLHRIGLVGEDCVDELADALTLLPKDPLSMTFWKLETMESPKHPLKIVLKLTDPTTNTFRVHSDCYPLLLRAGIRVDTRPWFPHIVLGHVPAGRHGFQSDLSQIHVPQFTFNIHSVGLFETQRGRGVRYEPVAQHILDRL